MAGPASGVGGAAGARKRSASRRRLRLMALVAATLGAAALVAGCATASDQPAERRLVALRPEWTTPPAASTDEDIARQTLLAFFAALSDEDYERAAELYGGSYVALGEASAEADPADRPAAWRRVCASAERRCLPIGDVTATQRMSGATYRFMVRFVTGDGRPLEVAACCGDEAEGRPAESRFPLTVRRIDGRFRVVDGPIFAP